MEHDEVPLEGGSRTQVTRRGATILRTAAPWSRTTIALLRHLEKVGFVHAPRVVGTGFAPDGREELAFVEGEFVHPGPWDDDALPVLGGMLAALHWAMRSFVPPSDALWQPWFGRTVGQPSVLGHCDTGPWNIVSRQGRPVAFIDWETAGPVDPRVELAQAVWLNAQLVDDDIAERQGLPSVEARARQMRLLLDGYGLARADRVGFVDLVRDFVVLAAANEAIGADVTPESNDAAPLWGLA